MATWTTEHLDLLRQEYGKVPVRDLARRLGRTVSSLRTKARVLRLVKDRRWSDAEIAIVRRDYGTMPAPQLAARLGCPLKRLHTLATRLGITRPKFMLTKEVATQIRQQAEEGLCNRHIARAVGAERHTIARWRQRLGLPPLLTRGAVKSCPLCQSTVRKNLDRQCKAAGVQTLGQIRAQAYRDFAMRNGWPADLRPRAVQILNLLAAVGTPLTRRQIVTGIDVTWRGSRKSMTSNDPEGSYLAHLAARGLVLRMPRALQVLGEGRGRTCDLYCLGPAALAILEERARCEQTRS